MGRKKNTLTWTHLLGILGTVCATTAVACTGSIGSNPESTKVGGAIPSSLICQQNALSPGLAPIRRLTKTELKSTIEKLFEIDISSKIDLLPQDPHVNGYNNQSDALGVTRSHVEALQGIAEFISQTLFPDTTAIASAAGCDPASDSSCLENFINRIGRRLYRRPLNTAEQEKLRTVIDAIAGGDSLETFRVATEAMLQTPQFLFRPEVGESNEERPGLKRLTGYELATRLAFALWRTSPDEALLDAAAAGQLDTVEGLTEVARQMISDERVDLSRTDFATQWLHISDTDTTAPPGLDEGLKTSALTEASLLIKHYLSGDENALGIFTSDFSFLDSTLAEHYAVSGSFSSSFTQHAWAEQSPRKGFFGTAAFAIGMAHGIAETSIIHRGKFVREMLLCDPLPPPPPGISTEGVERLEDPTCKGCHEKMDPIGNGLELFDVFGAERTQYADASALPAHGTVIAEKSQEFSGASELGTIIASNSDAPRCMVTQYFRWLFGRMETETSDSCTLDTLEEQYTSAGGSFEELVIGTIASDAFRFVVPAEDG